MFQSNESNPKLYIKSNTFVSPHNLSCTQLKIEQSALSKALSANLGVVYATSTTDSKTLDLIKDQCVDAGKKVFFVSFTEPTIHHGFNPFLNLEPAQIAHFYFELGSKEHEQLTTAFENHTDPYTPEVVLKTIQQNQALFKNKALYFEPLVKNLEAIVSSINPFSNTDKSQNVDLSSIINEGHVLILGGLNDLLLADEFKAFINDYYLEPLFLNNQINANRNIQTYSITSSESAVGPSFAEKVFTGGNQVKIRGLYTEYRTALSDYESIHFIYSNSQNKIKDDSPKLNPFNKENPAVDALKAYLSELDGTVLKIALA